MLENWEGDYDEHMGKRVRRMVVDQRGEGEDREESLDGFIKEEGP